ncbi:uncharacterized protein [Procambarus clarkii]|uniref:uncharacterized protein n=1 Tax=Procambarus clarkii TaxID=6728 RepID=UPI0037438150
MAYQLVPEAYRQKFRNLKKSSKHTFTEFATIKERLFQEWCASRKVKTKEDLEQLKLLEDFKDCLSGDLKTYLEEQQVETLSAAATMAEEYILTHRPSARYVPKTYSRYSAKHKPEEKTAPRSATKLTQDSPKRFSPKRDIMCWTCGKKGHMAAKCRSNMGNNPHREVMLVSSIVPPMATLEKRKELFAPYTSQGDVSSDHSGKPVVVLRDSGAAQSLILEKSLPEGVSVNVTQKVILGGFPSTLYVAPLIKVYLESQHFKGESVTSSHSPDPPVPMPVPECWTKASLLEEQRKDPQVQKLANTIESPTKEGYLYVWSNEVLCRRCPPKYPQSTEVGKQIVVPAVFQSKLLETAHADRFVGHGGVSKTFHRLAKSFYWLHMKKDIRRFCKTCHACQMAGKANQPVPKAPLCPIPSIGEPFEHLILDIVGPLPPSTSGVQYLLTIFNRIADLGIQHITSSAYHPESQGALKRFHQTLKGMLRKFCYDQQSKIDACERRRSTFIAENDP